MIAIGRDRASFAQQLTDAIASRGLRETREIVRELDASALLSIEQQLQALRDAVAAIADRPDTRIAEVEKAVANATGDILALHARIDGIASAPVVHGEVMPSAVADMMDRVSALENLVVESMEMPTVLAKQLQLTSEIMQAMDERARANRDADQRALEAYRSAGEQAAHATGGLAAVVEVMRIDINQLTAAVEDLRHRYNRRDGYTAQLLKTRRVA